MIELMKITGNSICTDFKEISQILFYCSLKGGGGD